MDIYVVQPGDTIDSIAALYGVAANRLIQDNGLKNPFDLVQGQTIVIARPSKEHTVQEGDTVAGIASLYGVTVMQLLRNNSFLNDREYIIPGETLVISYPAEREIAAIGYTYPFIREDILRRTLPYLTYLSVLNYRASDEGVVTTYSDDTEIVRIAKEFGTIPLAMLTTLSAQGEADLNVAYKLLLNVEYQEKQLDNLINIMREKGYLGANFVFYFINTDNQALYEGFLKRVNDRLTREGFLVFVTINFQAEHKDGEIVIEKIDYAAIARLVNQIVFLRFIWGVNYGPPEPVSSIQNIQALMEYVIPMVSPDKIMVAKPTIAYDWTLPYPQGNQGANSITLDVAIAIANDYDATIQLDESSATPFYNYTQSGVGTPTEHIVWSLDARSIEALLDLISEYGLYGMGIWNIMVFNQQIWTVVISGNDIIKLLPDNIG